MPIFAVRDDGRGDGRQEAEMVKTHTTTICNIIDQLNPGETARWEFPTMEDARAARQTIYAMLRRKQKIFNKTDVPFPLQDARQGLTCEIREVNGKAVLSAILAAIPDKCTITSSTDGSTRTVDFPDDPQ